MPIEKAFAIHGEPDAIWDALWSDLSRGAPGTFEVERAQRPHTLVVRVDMGGGVPARIAYRIEAKEDHTEVSATLEPLGLRYNLYQFLTFGRVRLNYELLLVQGLSNLKHTVEGLPLLRPAEDQER